MRRLIKNLTIATFLTFGISTVSIAQVTETDVDLALILQETTFDAINTIYIYNVKKFYTDGSVKYVYSTFENLEFSITESGLFIKGKGVSFYPFSSFKSMNLSATSMTFHLFE